MEKTESEAIKKYKEHKKEVENEYKQEQERKNKDYALLEEAKRNFEIRNKSKLIKEEQEKKQKELQEKKKQKRKEFNNLIFNIFQYTFSLPRNYINFNISIFYITIYFRNNIKR